MYVVATAGHVDHGKSTLVRALTGMEPDRWAEERRRGMTIDLGFAWTRVGNDELAFVDVPGHEKFVSNMLAGAGPAPAALLVVAADEGWMPQTEEHVAALDALGVRHGLVAVTRTDLADPGPVGADIAARLASTSLGQVETVPVSAPLGQGVDELRAALRRLVDRLPAADQQAAVRLWVDRVFTVRGSGTVVTGTLGAGTLRLGDELEVAPSAVDVRVRGLQALGEPRHEVAAVARVAVNLRGIGRDEVARGDALVTPGAWTTSNVVDVRVGSSGRETTAYSLDDLPPAATLHVGSAAIPVRVRSLARDLARLTLASHLPLTAGDIGLLRDPGAHRVLGRVTVLDTRPPPLSRRGAAGQRAAALDTGGTGDVHEEIRRRGVVSAGDLAALGLRPSVQPLTGEWYVDPGHADQLRARMVEVVAAHRLSSPLDTGPPVDVVRRELGLPDPALAEALVEAPLAVRGARIVDLRRTSELPAPLARSLEQLRSILTEAPFAAPDAAQLEKLGLGVRELAAAERAGELLRLTESVVLLRGADDVATEVLAGLEQPFTLSEARQALGTSRRVAVPLLELLDRTRRTRRLPDDRRVVV